LGSALAVTVVLGTVVEDVGFALGRVSEGFMVFGTKFPPAEATRRPEVWVWYSAACHSPGMHLSRQGAP
jgi:hypothetical protein